MAASGQVPPVAKSSFLRKPLFSRYVDSSMISEVQFSPEATTTGISSSDSSTYTMAKHTLSYGRMGVGSHASRRGKDAVIPLEGSNWASGLASCLQEKIAATTWDCWAKSERNN